MELSSPERLSTASELVLAGLLAAGLATVYGAREPFDELSLEAVVAALVAVVAVGIVPFTLAVSRRPATTTVVIVALASAGAAAIHFAVIRDHFQEYWLYGLFFVATGLFQLAWAVGVLLRPTRLVLALGILVNAGIVAAWIVTRTVGLLIGPSASEVEPVGLADALSSAFEVVIVLGAAVMLVGRDGRPRLVPRPAATLTWLLLILTAGATTLGLLSVLGVAPGVLPPAA